MVGTSTLALIAVLILLAQQRALAGLRRALAQAEEARTGLVTRFKPVLDVEAEAAGVRATLEQNRQAAASEQTRISAQNGQLRERYAHALRTYETLSEQVHRLEENLEDISYGLYQPHFTYADSEQYKSAVEQVRTLQKVMLKRGEAATCGKTWEVQGSKREGERMMKQYQRLIIRGFNAESDAAIANVTGTTTA